MVDLLLLIPPESFILNSTLIDSLITIAESDGIRSDIDKETKQLLERSISLIYMLTTNKDIRKIISDTLQKDNMSKFFRNLSTTSPNEHVQFMSALIDWILTGENMTNQEYSPEMIKTFVHYLYKCEEDPLQKCHGVPLDSMITTLIGMNMIELLFKIQFTIA